MKFHSPCRWARAKVGLTLNNMDKNLVVAITGGLGSGKSQALLTLKNAGYHTISCDEITNELYNDKKVIKRLAKMFPNAKRGFIFLRVDKKEIAKTVFSNPQKLASLTEFLTPLILKQSLLRAQKNDGVTFIEVPLLFETNAQDNFDKVLVIKRQLTERINSVMKRSNLTKEQVLERINAQFDYDNNDLENCVIINNDDSIESFRQAVMDFAKSL